MANLTTSQRSLKGSITWRSVLVWLRWIKGSRSPVSRGDSHGHQEEHLNCTGILVGYWWEEPKVGKGKDLDGLGRNKRGKMKGYRDEKSWLHVNRLLTVRLVWLCLVPYHHSENPACQAGKWLEWPAWLWGWASRSWLLEGLGQLGRVRIHDQHLEGSTL